MNMDRAMRWVDDQVEAIKEPFVRYYDRLFWRMLMRRGKRRQMAESAQYDNAPHFMVNVLQRLSKLCCLLEGLEWHANYARELFSQESGRNCERDDNSSSHGGTDEHRLPTQELGPLGVALPREWPGARSWEWD